jgi:hypothetical protein
MYWLTVEYGVVGAALAWAVRVTISTLALALLAHLIIKSQAASRPSQVAHEYQ